MLNKTVVLTGDRPTGKLHLGHYVGSLKSRVSMQDEAEVNIIIADAQALTDKYDDIDQVVKNVAEVCIDYLSCGVDPEKSTIFLQSRIPELYELSFYFLNLVTVARLERNPTVKAEIQQKGFQRDIPAGFLTYPVSQAADIAGFRANVVPVGEDQLPMIEQTNEIIRKFHNTYQANIFPEVKALVSQTSRLVGIDGKAKMSKTLGNVINIGASPAEIKQAVHKMYTDPDHLKVSDPGRVEGNVVFAYLDVFDDNREEVEALKAQYRKGGLGDSVLKKRLEALLVEKFGLCREKRTVLEKDPRFVQDVIMAGTAKARKKVQETLEAVKSAMGISYKEFT